MGPSDLVPDEDALADALDEHQLLERDLAAQRLVDVAAARARAPDRGVPRSLAFEVEADAQGMRVIVRACWPEDVAALGELPGTWVAVYCERAPAVWLELHDRLGHTLDRDRDFEMDLLRASAWAALSRRWWRLRCLGWMRWGGSADSYALTFTGERVEAPASCAP